MEGIRTTVRTPSRFFEWLDERTRFGTLVQYLSTKTVPRHKHSLWYYFGGLTLFFFIVQIVTGVLLALYYKPIPELAHESVRRIVNEIPHGWLIRSIHNWGANLMVASLLIHMFSVFFLKAYRRPREVMWLTGVLLMLIVFGFCFTGYLLPWDTTAYFATLIGTEVPRTLPIIGDWGVSLLKGEEQVGSETLSRMYVIHIIILPLTALFFIAFHILLNQIHGSSSPVGVDDVKPAIPFFPNFVLRDFVCWSLGAAALLTIASLSPAGLGEIADPYASAPVGIKPEWYFLPLYQTLRMAPATIFGINGELIVNLLVVALSTIWFLIPFLDRNASKGVRSRWFIVAGIAMIGYLIVTIILAYTT
ncbi:MAG: cytochrome bc complex cytochrome b subunit [Ignavibacteria bacterium]